MFFCIYYPLLPCSLRCLLHVVVCRLLNLDLVPRGDSGEIVSEDTTSVMDLFRIHQRCAQSLATAVNDIWHLIELTANNIHICRLALELSGQSGHVLQLSIICLLMSLGLLAMLVKKQNCWCLSLICIQQNT